MLTNLNSESLHTELEFRWVKEAVSLLVNSSEENSESSQSISWLLLFASLDYSGRDVPKAGYADFVLVVRVSLAHVLANRLSEINLRSFLVEVNVAVEAIDTLGLVSSLSET